MGDINVGKVRSICIAGPPGCGKKLLAHGLIRELGRFFLCFFGCHFLNNIHVETGAVLFNISPDVVVQFQDNIKKFIANLTKLSKIIAPSALFINNAHFPFIKKVFPFQLQSNRSSDF